MIYDSGIPIISNNLLFSWCIFDIRIPGYPRILVSKMHHENDTYTTIDVV